MALKPDEPEVELVKILHWAGRSQKELSGLPETDGRLAVGLGQCELGLKTLTDESWERLAPLLGRRLRGSFMSRGCSAEAANELSQNTLLKVFKGMGGLEKPEAFVGWFYRIAQNVHSTWRKANGFQPQFEDIENEVSDRSTEAIADPDEDALTKVLTKEQRELVLAAMRQLPPRQRRCLMFRVHGEFSTSRIALILGITEGAVRAHLFQARSKLREILGCSLPKLKIEGD